MRTFVKRYFYSWREAGETATALANTNGDWFKVAMNCLRDGDMGKKDSSGVYERLWAGDNISTFAEPGTKRMSTIEEAELYLEHCKDDPVAFDFRGDEKIIGVVLSSDASYVLYEKIMTRKQQIEGEARRRNPYSGGTKGDISSALMEEFIAGAEWADKTMIDKAVAWLEQNANRYIYNAGTGADFAPKMAGSMYEDFRKAMDAV